MPLPLAVMTPPALTLNTLVDPLRAVYVAT
jgi:hypothetical protein